MTRVVIGVAGGQVRVLNPRVLIEEAARPTARDRVDAGHCEGAVGRGPDGVGVGVTAQEAGRVDGGERHPAYPSRWPLP